MNGSMNERIKKIRKHFKLSQEEFAKRIGIKRTAISNYEIGRNLPVDAVIALICREFDINEEWIRTGHGTMFIEPQEFSLDDFARKRGATDLEIEFVKTYFTLSPDTRREIMENFSQLFSQTKDTDTSDGEMALAELHAEIDRQWTLEKDLDAGSAASGSGNSGTATA